MDNKNFPVFFLAANSADGFYSEFGTNYNSDWTAYIIKGGPGTGKSSLMRSFAEKAAASGFLTILCPCSSDPESLDSVILPKQKTIILDGTAPHIVEPQNPGLCEQIINTGDFWDINLLRENSEHIKTINAENKSYHKKATLYIAAAGQLKRYNFSHALSATDIDMCFNFGNKIARKYIRVRGKDSQEWRRFLSGITPKGYIFYADTLNLLAEKRIVIRDEFGAAASVILSAIRDYALSRHHEIITVKNPILPNDIIDAVIIPDLSLAFIREEYEKIDTNSYKINALRFYNKNVLNTAKEKIKFNKKAYNSILKSATDNLHNAKSAHDRLEKYYASAMDFNALNCFTEKFLNNVL